MQNRLYMKQDSPFQDFPAYVEKSSPKSKFVIIFVVVLFLLVGTLAGLYFLGITSKKSSSTMMPVPTQAIVPTAVPEASPSASVNAKPSGSAKPTGKITPSPTVVSKKTVDRSLLTIAVLNGSGTAGAAKQISAALNGLGYTIKTVGNADSFTYTNITIKIKKSKSSFLDQLKTDISSKVSTPVTTQTDDTIATDAHVIVGK